MAATLVQLFDLERVNHAILTHGSIALPISAQRSSDTGLIFSNVLESIGSRFSSRASGRDHEDRAIHGADGVRIANALTIHDGVAGAVIVP
jgi:hypothetical protein